MGWRWRGNKFGFSWTDYQLDVSCNRCPIKRTTEELTKAMTSLVSFLDFTGEDTTMFPTNKLPTLDTEIWEEKDSKVKFSFYEKPTVGNRVLLADTALPEDGLRATLIQEVVRRL